MFLQLGFSLDSYLDYNILLMSSFTIDFIYKCCIKKIRLACFLLSSETANTSGLWFISGFPVGRVLQTIQQQSFSMSSKN